VVEISADHSRIRVLVAATNEELMIGRETAQVILARKAECAPRPIPIAVHACHVHLSRPILERLFGAGVNLDPLHQTSQSGQFVCRQKVSILGPRGRIDDVCVIGPLRPTTQVEIARGDEFRLGVDAPIRPSGRLEGSAPVTLKGPGGQVHLKEGMICAHRHIHMNPEDAERFCVRQGDEVEVELTGGSRPLVFGEVQVRIRPDFDLEMHLDTDEANAAGLPLPKAGEEACRIPAGRSIRAEIRRHTRRRHPVPEQRRSHD
jgi:acetate kinase